MKLPDEDGLPVWAFIMVMLLTTLTLALVAYAVWRRCVRPSRGVEHLSSSVHEPPECKVYVREGRIARFSGAPPPARTYGGRPSSKQSPAYSNQWPQKAYSDGHDENQQELSNHYPVEQDVGGTVRRSRPDVLPRECSVALKDSPGLPSHEEIRSSYISSDSIDVFQNVEEISPKPNSSGSEPPHLDCPTPLSPFTPLALSRLSQHSELGPTTLRLLSKYGSIPPPLPAAYRLSRYRDRINSARTSKHSNSKRRDSRFSLLHGDAQLTHGHCSPAVTRESFLQAWSNACQGLRAHPEAPPPSREPAEASRTKKCHVNVVQIMDTESKTSDEQGVDISPLSSASITSASPVSRTQSFGASSTWSAREKSDRTPGKGCRNRQEQISWLIDH